MRSYRLKHSYKNFRYQGGLEEYRNLSSMEFNKKKCKAVAMWKIILPSLSNAAQVFSVHTEGTFGLVSEFNCMWKVRNWNAWVAKSKCVQHSVGSNCLFIWSCQNISAWTWQKHLESAIYRLRGKTPNPDCPRCRCEPGTLQLNVSDLKRNRSFIHDLNPTSNEVSRAKLQWRMETWSVSVTWQRQIQEAKERPIKAPKQTQETLTEDMLK